MSEWKKVVLVIKKEDLISEVPDLEDCIQAWYGSKYQLELDSSDTEVRWLESKNKEFKKTWHITIKFRQKGWWEYED